MNILILGGAGFLGANLTRHCLLEPEARVTVVDSLDPLLRSSLANLEEVWSKIRFIKGDIRDENLLAQVVLGQDVIFNCAGQTSHPMSITHPVIDAEINCVGNLKLLEAVRAWNKAARVVYTSSSTVIGKALNPVVDEDHPERPLEIYSANKSVAEKYYRIYHIVHGLSTIILRFANLYGPYGKGFPEFGFVNYFIHLAWADQPIEIFGSGAQTRNVMYVDDAVDILWLVARRPDLTGEVYFAAGDEHLGVREIAETIVAVFGRGRVTQVEWPEERRRIEIGDVKVSSARLRALTGWKPRHDLVSGLQRTRAMLERASRPSETPG